MKSFSESEQKRSNTAEIELMRQEAVSLFNWYTFHATDSLLIITSIKPIAERLSEREDSILERWLVNSIIDELKIRFDKTDLIVSQSKEIECITGKYDYIIVLKAMEQKKDPVDFLVSLKDALNWGGRILMITENRLGVRFFCGDKDPYSGGMYDGIEGYPGGIEQLEGHLYSYHEICNILDSAEMSDSKFYALWPHYLNLEQVYTDTPISKELGYGPGQWICFGEKEETLIVPYNTFRSLFEKYNLSMETANAYIIEYSSDDKYDETLYAKVHHPSSTMDCSVVRIFENADGVFVDKIESGWDGAWKAEYLERNFQLLNSWGIKTVEGRLKDGKYTMPYYNEETGSHYFFRLWREDRNVFYSMVDKFIGIIMSQPKITADDGRVLFEKGFPDLMPWNCFVIDGEFVFFDQPVYKVGYPIKIVISTFLNSVVSNQEIRFKIGKKYELSKEDLINERKMFQGEIGVDPGRLKYRGSYIVEAAHANRKKMELGVDEYDSLFLKIWDDLEGEVMIFGSGSFARCLLDRHMEHLNIIGIIDNDDTLWGNEINGIKIFSPETLAEQKDNDTRVIICMDRYRQVLAQVRTMGIKNISVYDPIISEKIYKKSEKLQEV